MATTDIFIKCYKEILKPYEILKERQKCLLILDDSPPHINAKIIDLFNSNQTEYIYIPAGLTPYL